MLSLRVAGSLACALLLGACAGGPGGYWTNRSRDLTDVAHVDMTGATVGGAAHIGPATLGWVFFSGWGKPGTRWMLGLGGLKEVEVGEGVVGGIIFPFAATGRGDERLFDYEKREPGWWSIGIDLGMIVGFGAEVDFLEAVDFLVGVIGVDLMGDDLPAAVTELEPESS